MAEATADLRKSIAWRDGKVHWDKCYPRVSLEIHPGPKERIGRGEEYIQVVVKEVVLKLP